METRFAKLILLQLHMPGSLVPGPPLHLVAFSWAGFSEATSKEVWAHARLPQAIVSTAAHRIDITRTPCSTIVTPSNGARMRAREADFPTSSRHVGFPESTLAGFWEASRNACPALRRNRSAALPRLRQHFVRRRHAALREANLAVGPNQINRPLHDQPVSVIERSHLLAFIHQQRERKVKFLAELLVLRGALRIHAENRDPAALRFAPTIAKLAQLFGAARRIVTGIENQHDIVASQCGKPDHVAALVGQREIRRLHAGRNWVGKEPGKHHCTVTETVLLCCRLTSRMSDCAPGASPAGTCTSTWYKPT